MACAADGRGARVLERGGARRRADRASVTRRDDVAQRQLRRLHGPQRPTPSHRPSTTPPHRSTFTVWSLPPFPWVIPSDAERDRIHSIPRDGSSLETRSGVRTLPFPGSHAAAVVVSWAAARCIWPSTASRWRPSSCCWTASTSSASRSRCCTPSAWAPLRSSRCSHYTFVFPLCLT